MSSWNMKFSKGNETITLVFQDLNGKIKFT